MTKFYFNTGVNPANVTNYSGLYGNQVIRGGTVQIPFECDVPENAVFMFACDSNDLPEADTCLVAEIKRPNKCMLSKYAYFKI